MALQSIFDPIIDRVEFVYFVNETSRDGTTNDRLERRARLHNLRHPGYSCS